MASQDLKQRIKDEPNINTTTTTNNNNNKTRREKKMAMAKRGLRSLAIAFAIPTSLTFTTLYLFGSGQNYYQTLPKSFWFPPLWAIHLAYLGSSFLMGLSAWLVWAEGGFHRQPTTLPLYLAQLVLSLSWYPVVLKIGAIRLGLMVCMGMFGAFVGCSRSFREVNPIAGDLVKPCLAMAAFLVLMNYKLL